jgi:hypothetical protein
VYLKEKEQIPFIWQWHGTSYREKNPLCVRKLFKSWDEVLHQYEHAWRDTGDLPYIYDERAQVGLLAISSRIINGYPLTEFSVDRIGNISGRGYCDLGIVWQRKDFETWIEAGHIRISWYDLTHNFYDKVYMRFWHAKHDIRSLKKRGHSLAILFIRFYNFPVHKNKDKEYTQTVQELKSILNKTTRRLNADFFTLHLCSPKLVAKSKSEDCPGIAVIGQLYKSP